MPAADGHEAVWLTPGQAGGPGTFAGIPGGAAHTFGNASAGPARLLVLHAPAMDRYFAELDDLWAQPDPPTVAQERDLMARHGTRPA